MKYVLNIIAALFLLTSSIAPVFADEMVTPISWYGRVSIGSAAQVKKYIEVNGGQSEWDFESGLNCTVAAGYTVPYLALEGELGYRKLDIFRKINTDRSTGVKYTGGQTQVSIMLNGYFIPKPEWKISPYVGLGIGTTTISWNDVRAPGGSSITDDSDTVFTYQLIAGASYKINPQFTLTADYWYFVPGDLEIEVDGAEGKLNNQELNIFNVALRFKL
jgi:opacity protein-like surface antigen